MKVYVYKGYGASTFSSQYLKRSLTIALQNFGYDVRFISPEEILDGSLLSPNETKMFVMGGGSFTDVKKALGEAGLTNIKNYIQDGGLYTGICMGSYAAFADIDFRGEQRKTSNGLGFFNATARGSLPLTLPYDGTGNSATIIEAQHTQHNTKFPALYWGGNGMDEQELIQIGAEPLSKTTLASGEEKVMSARINVGNNGGKAVLCGYHPEGYDRSTIWKWLAGFPANSDCYKRLEHELLAHPDKAYLMALACMLDDIEIVSGHSFVTQVNLGLRNVPYKKLALPEVTPSLQSLALQ